jgi:hypothetical protein
LRLLFSAFFRLVAVSVGATSWGSRAQAGDALLINLAGRHIYRPRWKKRIFHAWFALNCSNYRPILIR